jgi:hypothetical protein
VIFYGSEGRLEIDAEGDWKTFMGPKGEPGPDSSKIQGGEKSNALVTTGTGSNAHYVNFIEAVKAGKQSCSPVTSRPAYRSSVLPIMANIAYRTGRELKWDGKKEQFIGDAAANKLLRRNDRKGLSGPEPGRHFRLDRPARYRA